MEFVYQNPDLEAQLAAARSVEDVDAVLVAISRLVPSFMQPEIRGRQLFWPNMDAAVPQLARRLNLPDIAGNKSNDNVVIVATQFYATGGHSGVAADITRLIGKSDVSIIFTDIFRNLRYSAMINHRPDETPYHRRSTMVLSSATLVERIVELYMLLAAIRPTRIFLLGNHTDMVAVAGVWPFRDVVDYLHHADHLPAIGNTLPFSGHADLTYTCHLACQAAGVKPTYVGMTVNRSEPVPKPERGKSGRLRIATCGALHKYRLAARYRWSDFVVAALSAFDAELIHIGPWDEDFATEMRSALSQAGLAPDRYIFTSVLPDLAAVLVAQQADAYLSSYPDTGGKANLEAMVAGLAPIVAISEDLPPLNRFDLPLSTWVRISEPSETAAAVRRSLDLSAALRLPEGQAALTLELDRFETFVRGATPA
ncbi:hypothetical protein BH11PSE1_BH11PSE1_07950 [soil metagenome]